MTQYLFSSHDGFGLGHVRRNTLIARMVAALDPTAQITIVTGVASEPGWLRRTTSPRFDVIRVPALLKDASGAYGCGPADFDRVIAQRAERFDALIATRRPAVVVVDRHPLGTAGELRLGLERARRQGSATVLGLRDVIDEPTTVAAEMSTGAWTELDRWYDQVLVYGSRSICDHEAEYGLPLAPRYCGWVVAVPPTRPIERQHLIITAGGGGDGARVVALGCGLLDARPSWRGSLLAGPYLDLNLDRDTTEAEQRTSLVRRGRLDIERDAGDVSTRLSSTGAVVQMAGYNATVEALAAGLRPILMPRRVPRREQAIRATRLSFLGLADLVDLDASADEVAWLLDQPRRQTRGAVERAGVDLDGADHAARQLIELAHRPRRSLVGAGSRSRGKDTE